MRECCRPVEVEVMSKSSNKIHQTRGSPSSRALYFFRDLQYGLCRARISAQPITTMPGPKIGCSIHSPFLQKPQSSDMVISFDRLPARLPPQAQRLPPQSRPRLNPFLQNAPQGGGRIPFNELPPEAFGRIPLSQQPRYAFTSHMS